MEKFESELKKKRKIISVAAGREPADLVLKNAVYVNVFSNELCTDDIAVTEGVIAGMGKYTGRTELDMTGKIVCPGFIDGHIHLESSLVSPREFVNAVLPHGTTTVVTDPHEIANVMGEDGIEYMMQATEGLPVDVFFMLPSCVPATELDESGAVLDYQTIDSFNGNPRVLGLAEMMNYQGVIACDGDVMKKLTAAQEHRMIIDGHGPGLMGKGLNAYIAAGVVSDHECSELGEALEKLKRGQYIMIREGTAAHNLEALAPILSGKSADRCMFCTDDKHPSDLLNKGHIDYIIKKAVSMGADPMSAVRAASLSAAEYFRLRDRGAIAPGYIADFAVIDSLESFGVEKVFKRGELIYDGKPREFPSPEIEPRLLEHAHNSFHVAHLEEGDFSADKPLGVIGLVSGEIVSNDCGLAEGIDIEKDILKIAVIERHKNTRHIGIGYIKGYGLKAGAVATSISHDSHNIIAVGVSDKEIAAASNKVVGLDGGIVVMRNGEALGAVSLPVAGIMSDDTLENVNRDLENAKRRAFELGVSVEIDPFMTLSFMSLPVIPALRLTTHGVFDVARWKYV
ncbi:MAG: adenine deaminase [Oscillospiraceae bacterium]|nr:adenine deaminase [Oscillospiraceae bacterium]